MERKKNASGESAGTLCDHAIWEQDLGKLSELVNKTWFIRARPEENRSHGRMAKTLVSEDEHRCVVVVCSHMKDPTSLIHILEGLSLDVIWCSDMDQLHKVLSRRDVPLVFCDEHVSEDCFRDLVSADVPGRKGSRVVVTIRTGEWDNKFF